MAGIYLHIPLCKQACYYCDFHFSTFFGLKQDLIAAMISEIALRKDYLGHEDVDTVYFGGGTPSILDKGELARLLDAIYENHKVSDDAEITIEANPDDLKRQKAKDLADLGFNRLSIGVQSFDNDTLSYLNRAHSSEESFLAIRNVVEAGFLNLNLDLIFSIQEGRLEILKKDVNHMLQLRPAHISAYSLTIEKRTVFGNWLEKGKIDKVSDDQAANEYEYIVEALTGAGYLHYEVSNFAMPGFISRHNSSYWKQVPYLGIGPSAHSFNARSRQVNINNNSRYIQAIKKGNIPAAEEVLSRADSINEILLTGLRTQWGADLSLIRNRFGVDLESYYKSYIQDLVKLNLATFNDGKIQLSKKGMLIADKISSDLFFIDKND